jgi:polysaccharide pyruvyl transferase WcaK-like protein
VIVEVRGANTRNKGAELMLRAIAAELGDHHDVVVEPRAGTYRQRARIGLFQKVSHRWVSDGALDPPAALLPRKVRHHMRKEYGLVLGRDVDVVLDASGFAYSDQFDVERSELAAGRTERARRAGRRTVLMPQAYGPFTSAPRRAAFVRIVDNSDLVYAREHESLQHVLESGARTDHVRLAPDFTCLIDGRLPPGLAVSDRLALVVPSMKLLTETGEAVRGSYVAFCVAAVELLRERDLDVQLLQHEQDDDRVIDAIQQALPAALPVVRHDDALELKGIIGAARIVVGSRFHALVSALSQGVPAIAAGWSHKYERLFEDYGCPENAVDVTGGRAALAERCAALDDAADALRDQLRRCAAQERIRAREMWAEIHALLAAGPGGRA